MVGHKRLSRQFFGNLPAMFKVCLPIFMIFEVTIIDTPKKEVERKKRFCGVNFFARNIFVRLKWSEEVVLEQEFAFSQIFTNSCFCRIAFKCLSQSIHN